MNEYDRLANYDLEDIKDAVFDIKEKIKEFENSYNDLITFLPELESNNDRMSKCYNLLKDKSKREQFYELFLNYSKLLNICQFSEHFLENFTDEEITKYKELFKTCIDLRGRLRNIHNESIDFREYESKMQKLYDEFIGAEQEVKVLTKIPNIFDTDFEKELEYLKEAQADAILNAAIDTIKEKMEENPELYTKLSERINNIIEKYENNRITQKEKLEQAKEIASIIRGENENEDLKYDERIRNIKCARSVYDNLEKYIKNKEILIEFSLFVYKQFDDVKEIPDWQNNSDIINTIKGDIDDKLWNLGNEHKIEKTTIDNEIHYILDMLLKIGLNIYSNYSDIR